tara:strand:+ start:7014 stop:7211 length:198 start_codon:yes stop_codon:yes gene_type:complete
MLVSKKNEFNMNTLSSDLHQLSIDMSIRKQENINLKYQIDKLQSTVDKLIIKYDNFLNNNHRREQ